MDKVIQSRSQCNNINIFKPNELSIISPVLCLYRFTSMVEAQTNLGSDAINIGATNCYNEDYLDNDDVEIPITSDMVLDTMDGLGNEDDMFFHLASTVARRSGSMLNTYRRYGGSHMRTPNVPSMQLLNMALIHLAQS